MHGSQPGTQLTVNSQGGDSGIQGPCHKVFWPGPVLKPFLFVCLIFSLGLFIGWIFFVFDFFFETSSHSIVQAALKLWVDLPVLVCLVLDFQVYRLQLSLYTF